VQVKHASNPSGCRSCCRFIRRPERHRNKSKTLCLNDRAWFTSHVFLLGRIECIRCRLFRSMFTASVSLSRGFAVQTRLNGARSCLGWRLMGNVVLDALSRFPHGFDAAFANLLSCLTCVVLRQLCQPVVCCPSGGGSVASVANAIGSVTLLGISKWQVLAMPVIINNATRRVVGPANFVGGRCVSIYPSCGAV